jgi:hypothetical protein
MSLTRGSRTTLAFQCRSESERYGHYPHASASLPQSQINEHLVTIVPVCAGLNLRADALHPVFEAPEVSVSATGRRRFPLHVPRTRIRELQ